MHIYCKNDQINICLTAQEEQPSSLVTYTRIHTRIYTQTHIHTHTRRKPLVVSRRQTRDTRILPPRSEAARKLKTPLFDRNHNDERPSFHIKKYRFRSKKKKQPYLRPRLHAMRIASLRTKADGSVVALTRLSSNAACNDEFHKNILSRQYFYYIYNAVCIYIYIYLYYMHNTKITCRIHLWLHTSPRLPL